MSQVKEEIKNAIAEVIEEQAPVLEKLAQNEQAYLAFVKRFRDRCSMWTKFHGNVNFPIIKGPEGLTWLNRETRRRLKLRF